MWREMDQVRQPMAHGVGPSEGLLSIAILTHMENIKARHTRHARYSNSIFQLTYGVPPPKSILPSMDSSK